MRLGQSDSSMYFFFFPELAVRFAQSSYTFNENDGTGIVQVEKIGVASESFEVRVRGGKPKVSDHAQVDIKVILVYISWWRIE